MKQTATKQHIIEHLGKCTVTLDKEYTPDQVEYLLDINGFDASYYALREVDFTKPVTDPFYLAFFRTDSGSGCAYKYELWLNPLIYEVTVNSATEPKSYTTRPIEIGVGEDSDKFSWYQERGYVPFGDRACIGPVKHHPDPDGMRCRCGCIDDTRAITLFPWEDPEQLTTTADTLYGLEKNIEIYLKRLDLCTVLNMVSASFAARYKKVKALYTERIGAK